MLAAPSMTRLRPSTVAPRSAWLSPGPNVERGFRRQPEAIRFPRFYEAGLISLQRLENAVLYATHGTNVARAEPPPAGPRRADLAASFQEAVVEVLVEKSRQALRKVGMKRLAVGGGVSANRRLRAGLERMTVQEGAELFIPPLALCTDNAAMAAVAVEKWRRRRWAPADLDASPNYTFRS